MSETASFLPCTITIDGTPVPLRIVRFTFESREAFARDYRKLEGIWRRNQALERLALVKAELPTQPAALEKAPEGEEATDAKDAREARNAEKLRTHADNISLALAMRELDESATQRAQREQLDAENDATAVRITRATFANYVTVDPACDLADDEGSPVRTGLDLLRSFPSQTLYATVLAEVLVQNTIAATLKKKSVSPSGSHPSSIEKSARSPAANGAAPAPSASSASTSDSAAPVAAMESQ